MRKKRRYCELFPNVPIGVTLNLNLPAYYNLTNGNGWIYVNEQQSGTRGLIVVNTASGFKAFDRNAPHLCPDNDTTLEVQGTTAIVCPKDKTRWMLNGTPEAGGKTSLPPKTYICNYDAGSKTLNIYY
ncbi:hypothetical protein QWZ06_23475 [Chryseobacterium tructae]|uniref:hypothetical protein n=1 Tax=Chryseobacterium tructae TaxID=1037380 RepID=UPI0025B4C38C|nr:hypothetical protein [Chryseobacterium tructae]MDN3694984.1 hypothetical protein [Chryseobacterium tructae]